MSHWVRKTSMSNQSGQFILRAPSAVSIANDVRGGQTSAEAVMRAALARIDEVEARIHAWEYIDRDIALSHARGVDADLAAGRLMGPLVGVPIAVKDIFDTADLPTAYGSRAYADHHPANDAEVVRRARASGAAVVGKTVTTEFAYFRPGPTVNPWRVLHTPGGSSSGSAAAVASGMVPIALGSQTAGSLIRPASYCGVFALKPTYGAIPTTGAKEFSPSLDTVGWLANTAQDLELMRSALLGIPFVVLDPGKVDQLRIGICKTHEWRYLDASGHYVWDAAMRALGRVNARTVEVDLPADLTGLLEAQKQVMAYEASRSLAADIETHGMLLSASIRDLASTGHSVSDQDYSQARDLAHNGKAALARIFEAVDALLVPAAPGEAPSGLDYTGDPVFSRVWTLLGCPCVNVPGLLGPGGMPVGMQLVGAPGSDRALLQIADPLQAVLLAG